MKPRDIFGLAVRILGVYFLYLGLYAVTQLLGSGLVENPDKDDVINGVLPVVFDLVVGCCLLKGGWLIRWAYPETSKPSEYLPTPAKRTELSPESAVSPQLTGMDQAEKKLAALVEKSK